MSMHKIPLTELEQSGLEKHHLPTDKPSQLSDCFRLGVQHATQNFNETVIQLCKEKNALQYKIYSLMLEFCPEEMTQEQIENWEQHQVKSNHSTREDIENSIRCSLELDGNKGTDSQWQQIKDCANFLENSMDSVMNADPKDAKFSEITFESVKKDFENIMEKQKHMKTIPMSSELTCGDGTGTKVSIESEFNKLIKRNNRLGK